MLVQCEDCRKAANGNCGKHFNSCVGGYPSVVDTVQDDLIRKLETSLKFVERMIASQEKEWEYPESWAKTYHFLLGKVDGLKLAIEKVKES